MILKASNIQASVDDKNLTLEILPQTTSTNDHLKTITKNNHHAYACLAELQTQGKGRFNRQWHSPAEKNIYLSLSSYFDTSINNLSGLSLVIGLAVCEAIEQQTSFTDCKIKWPNDLIANAEKLGGILIENEAINTDSCRMIIGVGLNVNMAAASEADITQAWTSLYKLTGAEQDRNNLAASLINTLQAYITRFSEQGLTPFLDEWQQRDYLYNKNITLCIAEKNQAGKCVGIDAQGKLLLQTADQKIKAFSAGEASIAK
jgi:BirA family biotin operon repressor/biotin-[acetyl-CoA-carboxylase] ligase